MTKRTRLDALQQGETFQLNEIGLVYRHLGFDAERGRQAFELANEPEDEWYCEGSRMVYPVSAATPAQDARPGITLTRDQLEAWAGRALSDDEVSELDVAISNSSIPEAIATIVANFNEENP